MRVVILTEGSSNIGFGHITRCTSLYQAFEEKGISPEFIVNSDEASGSLLKGLNYHIFNWIKERKKLYGLIKRSDAVIIDSYLADFDVYDKVSGSVKIPVYLDDALRIDYPRGIVVNGAIFAEELDYRLREGVCYLLGSRYAPLRKEFRHVPEKEIAEDVESIMITLGGDDVRNMTPDILGSLSECCPGLTKNVVIAKSFKNIAAIKKTMDDKTNLIYYPDADGMKRIMTESDIAISAGGQTLYELARVGVPTIAVAVADNQMNNIQGWQRAGFIEYAGWWEDKDVLDGVMQKMTLLGDYDLRTQKSQTGRARIDGHGAPRIIRKCIQAFFTDRVILRPAGPEDLNNVYKLAITKDIRNVSFQQDKISLRSHTRWFNQKLSDKSCLFLVGEIDNAFLGQVRLDMDGKEAVISISLVKKFRRLGIGEIVLEKAIALLKLHDPKIRTITAYVKKENASSIRFFRKAGFRPDKNLIIKNQNAVEFRYEINGQGTSPR